MIKYLFLILFIEVNVLCSSQVQEFNMSFKMVYAGEEILSKEKITIEGDNWIAFNKIKFYVGNFNFTQKASSVGNYQNTYYLIDQSDSSTLEMKFELLSPADSICFLIGTDSVSNVSGLYDGALDPLNGMYWAWNSGYINTKIEGISSIVKSPDKKFEYHIGGYLPPNTTSSQICLTPKSQQLNFQIDLSKVILSDLLIESPSITIPGEKSSLFANSFKNAITLIEP